MKDVQAQPLAAFYKELIAGGIAGACGKTSVAPFERTKILIQTGKAPSARVDKVLKFIYRTDGALGFFRGNGASVARIVPYAAIHYATYERFRAAIVPEARRLVPRQVGLHGRPPVWVDLLAGSCSGATAVTLTYPLDLVRTRMAYDTRAQHSTVVRTLREIAQREGLRGLYRGVTPTLAGILPYSGLKFYTYQKLKRVWSNSHSITTPVHKPAQPGAERSCPEGQAAPAQARSPSAQEAHPPVLLTLVFGACAGLVGQSLTYPLDIVRRRMQVTQEEAKGFGAMWRHAQAIIAEHGYKGMFRGLSINWIKAAPSTAVGFTVYDYAKHMLKLENHL